ncbi:lmo0937 family membrane protein [Alkalicoccus halolimnae]|jgi:hypothetical protein|uniref:Lmo0937 family membrane protein n=1 Tax=Alkalicoccus halolimnae TaxID=1667239 RepID=A0A5C7FCM5_9BACI|nr:lmo0937 family membrane protein [Alkalicoccus halolimnae]TXF85097.1 lmo0937 family membrane protein [Alkalicoccus halolimnae]
MLWTIIAILLIIWIAGLLLDLAGGLIHLILIIVVVVVIIRIVRGK